MQKVIEAFSSERHFQNEIQRYKILFEDTGIERYSQLIEESKKKLEIAKENLNRKAEYFLKGFTLHQLQRGLIKEDEREEIRKQHIFNSEDIEKMFSKVSNLLNGTQYIQNPNEIEETEIPKMSKELVEKAKAMGIQIKNHLSSLDDEDIEKIKSNVMGANKQTTQKDSSKKEENKKTASLIHDLSELKSQLYDLDKKIESL